MLGHEWGQSGDLQTASIPNTSLLMKQPHEVGPLEFGLNQMEMEKPADVLLLMFEL